MDGARDLGEPRRLHRSSWLSALAETLRAMWGLVAGGAFLAVSGQWMWIAPVLVASLLASIIGAVVRWRTFRYRVGADEIRIESGLLNRTHRSIPFDRIQDVDISQGPIARLLGTARAKLETGGSAGGKDDGVLAAVLLDEAEALRRTIRALRSGPAVAAVDTAGAEHAPEPPPLYAMDNKRLLLAGLFNFSLAVFAGLIGATQTLGNAIGFDPFRRSFWSQLEAILGPVSSLLFDHRIAAIVGGVLLLAVLGAATGLVQTLLRDFGFRIDRSEAGLRRRRGLFTRTDVTLQVRRVQAALIGTGPVRNAFGWRSLKLQSLAQDEDGKGDHLIAPLASPPEVDRLLGEIGIGHIAAVTEWQRVSRAYLFTFVIATSPLYLLAVGQSLALWWLGMTFAAAVAAGQFARWLAWARTGFALDSDRLLIRTGWWRRQTRVLPVRNIQSIELTENLVTRLFGTASITLGVAGGTGHIIPSISRDCALQLRRQLLSTSA